MERFPSPDGRHVAELEPTGEVFLERPLFRLRVDGLRIDSTRYLGRWVFGAELVWSSDSRWFAIQKWDIPDRGPQTSLLVLDLEERAWQIHGPNTRALMRPVSIEEDLFASESLDLRTGEVRRGQVSLRSALCRWGSLDGEGGLGP